jgi:hypothetical protein
MEVSDVRKRVKETIERAKRASADRRATADEAAGEYQLLLDRIAVPLFRQLVNVLRAEKYPFSVFTPGGSVRLMSDRSSDHYIELTLDTSGSRPQVIVHSSRSRGRRVTESELPVGDGKAIRDLTEEDVLAVVLKELEPLVER